MKPTVPNAPGNMKYFAGPQPSGCFASAGTNCGSPSKAAASLMRSNSSSQLMTSSDPQPQPSEPELSPTGMYSMKRTCSGRSIESFAKAR